MTRSRPWAWVWGISVLCCYTVLFKMASLQRKITRGKETGYYDPCTGKKAGYRNCPERAQEVVLSDDECIVAITNIFKN